MCFLAACVQSLEWCLLLRGLAGLLTEGIGRKMVMGLVTRCISVPSKLFHKRESLQSGSQSEKVEEVSRASPWCRKQSTCE